MATEGDHIAIANRNQELLSFLIPEVERFSEWVVTVSFYKALHVVEACFHNTPEIRHCSGHTERLNALKHNTRYKHIHKNYRPLWSASTIARYLGDKDGRNYRSFRDYHDPEKL